MTEEARLAAEAEKVRLAEALVVAEASGQPVLVQRLMYTETELQKTKRELDNWRAGAIVLIIGVSIYIGVTIGPVRRFFDPPCEAQTSASQTVDDNNCVTH
jgi:hypothetical protein